MSPHSDSSVLRCYRGLPMDTRVLMRWDFFEAADVPRDRQEQADWLFGRWAEMDRWVAERSGRTG
jgi:hypothetical protein